MDARSEKTLVGVHPDLVNVMETAAQSPQPFIVYYGLRTVQAQREAVASGHSQTMHSRHLPDANFGNVAMAVDVMAGTGDPYAKDRESVVFGRIAEQVHVAAVAAVAAGKLRALPDGSPALQWGGQHIGAWRDGQVSGYQDWGHFQLDPSQYA